MENKTKEKKKYQGFYECVNHERLAIFFQDKPPTLCRNCHAKLKNNLTLFLGQSMSNYVMLEHLIIQHTDMIQEILKRLEGLDKWIERLAGVKTKDEKEKK